MYAVCVTVLEMCSNADVAICLQATAIVTATSLMPWAYAVAIARPIRMQMAYATTRMTALASWMHVVCATALARCTNVDAPTSQTVHAIAMATNPTPSAFVEEHAKPTRMPMAFATTKTIA